MKLHRKHFFQRLAEMWVRFFGYWFVEWKTKKKFKFLEVNRPKNFLNTNNSQLLKPSDKLYLDQARYLHGSCEKSFFSFDILPAILFNYLPCICESYSIHHFINVRQTSSLIINLKISFFILLKLLVSRFLQHFFWYLFKK